MFSRKFHSIQLQYVAPVFAFSFLLLAGCGGATGVPVQGAVSVNGESMAEGSITFVSVDGKTKGGDVVVDGKYKISEAAGLTPGEYQVKINWRKKTGRMIVSEDTGEKVEQTIEGLPASYNTNTDLSARLGEGNNQYDFSLKFK